MTVLKPLQVLRVEKHYISTSSFNRFNNYLCLKTITFLIKSQNEAEKSLPAATQKQWLSAKSTDERKTERKNH